jgi:RsiW-degrading membrane proteinase PrsW (M82 family)
MIHILVFLYVTLMYLKYILWDLGKDKVKPLDVLPIGLLVGSFSIFLVHLMSPHNFLGYLSDEQLLLFFKFDGEKSVIKRAWHFDPFHYELLRNYVFTGMTEEISKFSAGFLAFIAYRKTKMVNLFFYVVLAASFFAFIENIHYLEANGPSVVFTRSLFSTTTHICLGLISGYFVVRALSKKKFINTILVSLAGIIVTAFLHGSFNLSIYLEMPFLNLAVWVTTLALGILSLQKVKKYI